MKSFINSLVSITIGTVCFSLLSSCVCLKGKPFDNDIVCPLKEDIYLNKNTFVCGNILGETPIKIVWNSSKYPCYSVLNGKVIVEKTDEIVPSKYISLFLVKRDAPPMQYIITERLKNSGKNETFKIKISKRKLEENHIAVYVPGCKAVLCKFCQK